MDNKKVVVALGRNAFSESFPKQQERVKAAAKAIADLVEEKYEAGKMPTCQKVEHDTVYFNLMKVLNKFESIINE